MSETDEDRTLALLALAYAAAQGAPVDPTPAIDWFLQAVREKVEQGIPLERALGTARSGPGGPVAKLRNQFRDLHLARAAATLDPDGTDTSRAIELSVAIEDYQSGLATPVDGDLRRSRAFGPDHVAQSVVSVNGLTGILAQIRKLESGSVE